MEKYQNAKLKLFKQCHASIVNLDDALSRRIIAEAGGAITYSAETYADIYASNITRYGESYSCTVHFGCDRTLEITLPDRIYIHNALAAFAVCQKLKIDSEITAGGFRL